MIFPYWLRLIYSGQPEINAYFHDVLGVNVNDRSADKILHDGLQALFALYRKYGIPTSFSEIHEADEKKDDLREQLSKLGEMQSIYTELSEEKLITMISESVHGI